MSKIVVVGLTALLVSAASQVQAQPAPATQADPAATAAQNLPTAAEWKQFTDARIDLLKNALQLTPAQQKFWPPVEEAIRARAAARQARVTSLVSRMEGRREPNVIELLRTRADNLGQRATTLKQFVDAWQPLYESLDNAQKIRLRIVTAYVLHEMRDAAYDRISRIEEESED